MGVYIPGRRIKVTPRPGLADTALVDSCIPEGLLWYTYQRKFESAPTSARPIVGRQQKVAYETEDFHRVVPRTGSITSLCEAENRDSPYASAVVPRPFTETSSARHPRPRAAWCAGEGAAGRLARRSLLTGRRHRSSRKAIPFSSKTLYRISGSRNGQSSKTPSPGSQKEPGGIVEKKQRS